MKVIDLLNKIAKGEEVPKKIKVHGEVDYTIFIFDKNRNLYSCGDYNTLGYKYDLSLMLNDEVEIIEEEKDIEEIDKTEIEVSMSIGEQICANKINELIREVNKLKNKER